MMNTGEVSNLFNDAEDTERILSAVRTIVQQVGSAGVQPQGHLSMMEYFTRICHENFHLVCAWLQAEGLVSYVAFCFLFNCDVFFAKCCALCVALHCIVLCCVVLCCAMFVVLCYVVRCHVV